MGRTGTNGYIYGPGGIPVEQISSGGTVTYLHHDQADSTRLLTGSTGTVTRTTTFDAYGHKTGSTGTSTTPLRYDSQYTSADTGLIYLRARVYDPATSQFLTVDPEVGTTRAPYTYAGDRPLNEADPSGRSVLGEVGNFLEPLTPIKYYAERDRILRKRVRLFRIRAPRPQGLSTGPVRTLVGDVEIESDGSSTRPSGSWRLAGVCDGGAGRGR